MMNIKNIIKWIRDNAYWLIPAIFGIIILADTIYGLFTNTKEAMGSIIYVSSYAIIFAYIRINDKIMANSRIDIKQFSDLRGVKNVFITLSAFFFICLSTTLIGEFIYEYYVVDVTSCLFMLDFSLLLFYAYVCLVKGKRNAIFITRCSLIICLGYLAKGMLRFLNLDIINNVGPIIINLLLIALCIKGLLITFGSNATKAFPISERIVRFTDIFVILLFAIFPLLCSYIDFPPLKERIHNTIETGNNVPNNTSETIELRTLLNFQNSKIKSYVDLDYYHSRNYWSNNRLLTNW